MEQMINKILLEWSLRVHDGMPNKNNPLHIVQLRETLSHMKLSEDVTNLIIQNLVEFHPFNDLLSGYSYFSNAQPDIENEGTYTENCDGKKSTIVTWPHTMSDVIQALIKAGITIESFNEHPFSPYECFKGLDLIKDKGYQLKFKGQQVPLLYSVIGRK